MYMISIDFVAGAGATFGCLYAYYLRMEDF